MSTKDIHENHKPAPPLGLGSSEGLGAGAEARDRYAPGTPCTVNTSGDMFMMTDAREFFGAPCVVIKRTKAGLILVALHGDLKRVYSFPQRNVDVLEAPNCKFQPKTTAAPRY
jgi:hypothetical protein